MIIAHRTTIEQRSFLFRENNSDKVYHISIEKISMDPNNPNCYSVPFRYGKRVWGYNKLTTGTKTHGHVSLAVAQKEFNKMVKEKERKGYVMFNNPEELEVYNTLAY